MLIDPALLECASWENLMPVVLSGLHHTVLIVTGWWYFWLILKQIVAAVLK